MRPIAAIRALCRSGILLLALSISRAQNASPPGKAASCQQVYAAGRYDDAARCYQAAAIEAGSPQLASVALLHQAEAFVHLGDLPGAEKALRASLKAAPDKAETLYLLGYVLQRRNQPAESLQRYTQAAALRPPTAEDLRIVALDYVLLGDYADARRWLERALAEHPENAEAWYDFARVKMHDGRFGDAATALQRSLALRPNSAKAEDNLGVCLEAENKMDAAAAAYERAVRIAATQTNPSELPYIDYGRLLIQRNAAATALPLLKRATELNPSSSEAFAEFSRAASGTGDASTALTAMEQAVKLDSKNSRLHFQLGRLYRAAGMAEKARREFDVSSTLYGQKSVE